MILENKNSSSGKLLTLAKKTTVYLAVLSLLFCPSLSHGSLASNRSANALRALAVSDASPVRQETLDMLLSPTRRVSSGAYDQSAGQVHINAQGIVNGPLLKENEGAACVKRLTSALIGAKNHELRTLLAGLTLRVYDGLNTPFELSEKGTVVRVDRRFLLALRGEADVLCALRALLLPALGRSTADTTKLTAADRKRLQDIGTRLGSSPWKIQLENHITALTATPASDLRSVVDDALLSVLDELASESALTLVPAASGLSLARPRISRKNQSVERRDRRRRLLFETVESRQLLSTTLTPADLATTPIPIGQERTGEIGHELVTSGTAPIYGPVYLRPGELFSNENATEVFGPAETGTGPYLGSVDLFGQERAETAPMRFAFSPVDPQTGAGTAEGISANNQWRYVYSYTIGENGQPALERLLSETTTLLTTVEGRPMTRVFTTTHDYVPAVTGALRDSIGVITGNSEFPLTTPITISTTHITDTGHDERGSPIYYQPLTARVATSFTISRNGVETPGRLISLNYPLGLGAFTPEVAHASQTEELHLHAARVFTHDPHPDGLNPNTVYVSELKPVGLDGDLYAGLFSGLGLRTLTGQPSPITREAPFQFLVYRVLNVGPGQQAAGPFVGTYRYSTREQTPSGGSYWSMEVGGSWTRSAEVEISHSIESGGGGGSLTVSGAMPRYTGSGGMEGRIGPGNPIEEEGASDKKKEPASQTADEIVDDFELEGIMTEVLGSNKLFMFHLETVKGYKVEARVATASNGDKIYTIELKSNGVTVLTFQVKRVDGHYVLISVDGVGVTASTTEQNLRADLIKKLGELAGMGALDATRLPHTPPANQALQAALDDLFGDPAPSAISASTPIEDALLTSQGGPWSDAVDMLFGGDSSLFASDDYLPARAAADHAAANAGLPSSI